MYEVNSPTGNRSPQGLTQEALCTIEIHIDKNYKDFSETDQQRILIALENFLEMEEGELKINCIREGRVIEDFDLPPEKAEQLLWAVRRGEFGELGIVDAEIVSYEQVQVSEPVQAPTKAYNALSASSEFELVSYYLKTRDLKVISYILDKYDDYLKSVILSMIKNLEEIQDIKQELFLKVKQQFDLISEHTVYPIRNLRTWLRRIAKNHIYEVYIRSRQPNAAGAYPDIEEEIYEQLDLHMDFERVLEGLRQLTQDERTYIELRFFADMKNREISQNMNWPHEKTRAIRDKALPKLRRFLGEKADALARYL